MDVASGAVHRHLLAKTVLENGLSNVKEGKGGRAAHQRTIGVYQFRDPCTCAFDEDMYAAKGPDLNITEIFFARVTTKLKEIQKVRGRCHSTDELEDRIHQVVSEIDQDKQWFEEKFDGLRRRYAAVVAANGGKTKY